MPVRRQPARPFYRRIHLPLQDGATVLQSPGDERFLGESTTNRMDGGNSKFLLDIINTDKCAPDDRSLIQQLDPFYYMQDFLKSPTSPRRNWHQDRTSSQFPVWVKKIDGDMHATRRRERESLPILFRAPRDTNCDIVPSNIVCPGYCRLKQRAAEDEEATKSASFTLQSQEHYIPPGPSKLLHLDSFI